MDLIKAFTYLTEDDDWLEKIGVGSLIAVVPVLNFANVGYELEVARRVARGEPRPLTDWSNLSAMFVDGFWLTLARLVYSLPIFLLMGVGWAAMALSLVVSSNRNSDQLPPEMLLGFGVFGCVVLFAMLYALLFSLLSPAIAVQYLKHQRFGACFDVGAILALARQNPSAHLIVWGGTLIAGLLLSTVVTPVAFFVSLIPCLGFLLYIALLGLMVFGVYLVEGHLLGQYLQTLATPLTPPASFEPLGPPANP